MPKKTTWVQFLIYSQGRSHHSRSRAVAITAITTQGRRLGFTIKNIVKIRSVIYYKTGAIY